MDELADHCDKAREFYGDKPGLIGRLTIDDIYACIARLARCIEAQRNEIDNLRAEKK